MMKDTCRLSPNFSGTPRVFGAFGLHTIILKLNMMDKIPGISFLVPWKERESHIVTLLEDWCPLLLKRTRLPRKIFTNGSHERY